MKDHWNKVYATKSENEVSWTQQHPTLAIQIIDKLNINKTANIIDIGGGDSRLVDSLLAKGFENITVLDISHEALNKAKSRLGSNASKVKWIVSDINDFVPIQKYDFWYDRAVFHFLTNKENISNYIQLVTKALNDHAHFLLATFSENGPIKCSGLEVTQYSEQSMKNTFSENFDSIQCGTENHITPFDTVQNFQYCVFHKKK